MARIFTSGALALLLSGCGSSGGSGSFISDEVDINVALTSNGATTSATYDSPQASVTIDGNASTSLFWAGNITGDSITVDFGSSKALSQLDIYTNDANLNELNASKVVELSTDNATWNTTAETSGGAITCQQLNSSGGHTLCNYNLRQSARYIRITIEALTAIGLENVHEIQATGF